MRKISLLAALGMLVLGACVKEQNPGESEEQAAGPPVFTATTETAVTKTALSGSDAEGYSILWQSGDRILIADNAGHAGEYSTSSTEERGDFAFVSGSGTESVAGPYRAWYPATLYDGGTSTLPSVQHYAANNIAESPMYASSESRSLAFKNLCGIIRLNLSTDDDVRVESVTLHADQGMSGAYTLSGDAAVISGGTAGITLDCGSGVALGLEPIPFHIAVPEGTYTNLSITVMTTSGALQTRISKNGIKVTRSKITEITLTFNSLERTSTDLRANGTANTYIVSAAGTYRFKATVKGNGGLDPLTGTTATTIDPADISGVTVLWEQGKDSGRAIQQTSGSYDISYAAGYVIFSKPVSDVQTTACVAIFKDGAGGTAGKYDKDNDEILWSWLIWVTPGPGTVVHNGKTFMDRNLGASLNGLGGNYARGFLFQWGRKDAFSAAAGDNSSVYYFTPRAENVFTDYPAEVKSMAYTIAHPTSRIVCWTNAIHSWMPESEYAKRPWREEVKTIYDPCPQGWKVPAKADMDGITGLPDTGLYGSTNVSNNLRNFGNSDKGYYWTSTISDDPALPANAYAYCNDGRNIQNWSQAEGYAIRPVRE